MKSNTNIKNNKIEMKKMVAVRKIWTQRTREKKEIIPSMKKRNANIK